MTSGSGNQRSGQISVELAATLDRLRKDASRRTPPTLGEVRSEVAQGGMQWSADGELLYPQDRTSLLIELDDLIQQYGEAAPAFDFGKV